MHAEGDELPGLIAAGLHEVVVDLRGAPEPVAGAPLAALLERIATTQSASLEETAQLCAGAIAADGLVRLVRLVVSVTDTEPSPFRTTLIRSQCPARDSSIELSTTS